MLDLRADDVALGGFGPERRGDGGVIALRCAGGEDDIERMRPYQFGHLLACRLDEGKNRSFAGAQDENMKARLHLSA